MENIRLDIRSHAIDMLDDFDLISDASELHHELFNRDYFIVGRQKAKEWLSDRVFDAIELIKSYEVDNFGECTTDFSDPEKFANMLAYIIGEEILMECKTLRDGWNLPLHTEELQQIKKELIQN